MENPYTKIQVRKAMDQLASDEFTCSTVRLLFTDVRQFTTDRHPLVREIGHLVAHPEAKTQGPIYQNTKRMIKELRDLLGGQGNRRGRKRQLVIKVSFTASEVVDQLFDLIKSREIVPDGDSKWEAIERRRAPLTLCILTLMQGNRFPIEGYEVGGFIRANSELNGQPGCLLFTAVVQKPSVGFEDDFVDTVLPLVSTDLVTRDWIVGKVIRENSHRSIFDAQGTGSQIRLVPVETVPAPEQTISVAE